MNQKAIRMMKSFKSNAWMLPQPVLIIGTYDKDGQPNAMNAAWGGQWDMHEIMISLGPTRQRTTSLSIQSSRSLSLPSTQWWQQTM